MQLGADPVGLGLCAPRRPRAVSVRLGTGIFEREAQPLHQRAGVRAERPGAGGWGLSARAGRIGKLACRYPTARQRPRADGALRDRVLHHDAQQLLFFVRASCRPPGLCRDLRVKNESAHVRLRQWLPCGDRSAAIPIAVDQALVGQLLGAELRLRGALTPGCGPFSRHRAIFRGRGVSTARRKGSGWTGGPGFRCEPWCFLSVYCRCRRRFGVRRLQHGLVPGRLRPAKPMAAARDRARARVLRDRPTERHPWVHRVAIGRLGAVTQHGGCRQAREQRQHAQRPFHQRTLNIIAASRPWAALNKLIT
jgi:hypothetical protein